MLEILNSGIGTANENMSLDEKLLSCLQSNGHPILHLYQWKKISATYGYFIRPENHLHLSKVALRGLDLARRPTGGGIVFHLGDLAFSFLMPSEHPKFSLKPLENYRFVNQVVLEVVQSYFSLDPELIREDAGSSDPNCQYFCMAKPTQYDVVYQGVKIAGAAQRKKRQGYLHQGTISLTLPQKELLEEVLLSQKEVLEAMQSFTFAPVGKDSLKKVRQDLEKLLAAKLENALKF